jgi:hypothetical protein
MNNRPQYEHRDSLGTPIHTGQPIAFTHSYLSGVKIGTVVKLTKKRVKIDYKYIWTKKDGTKERGSYIVQGTPHRTLVLIDVGPAVTMHMLKVS